MHAWVTFRKNHAYSVTGIARNEKFACADSGRRTDEPQWKCLAAKYFAFVPDCDRTTGDLWRGRASVPAKRKPDNGGTGINDKI